MFCINYDVSHEGRGAPREIDDLARMMLRLQRCIARGGVGQPGADGLIYRGLMIRHLVMPNGTSGTQEVMQWIARNLPRDTYVNLMAQYIPVYKAADFPEIARRITRAEYRDAVAAAREAGLTNLDVQGAAWL